MGGMMPPGPGIPPLMPGMPPGRSGMTNPYCGESYLNYSFNLDLGLLQFCTEGKDTEWHLGAVVLCFMAFLQENMFAS